MISRSLGPEFGGAIGIMFTVANSIAVSMYIIGFCDALLDMILEYAGTDAGGSFTGITGDITVKDELGAAARLNDIRVIGK